MKQVYSKLEEKQISMFFINLIWYRVLSFCRIKKKYQEQSVFEVLRLFKS